MAFDLRIMNTFFKKRDEHLITFKSGSNRSQIDYFLVRGAYCLVCKDCKVIPGECLVSQHRLIVPDICLEGQQRMRKESTNPRTRWSSLLGENLELFRDKMLREARWDLEGYSEEMWTRMAGCIRRISQEVFGESKGRGSILKEASWWTTEVQAVVKGKKEGFKSGRRIEVKKILEAKKAVGLAKMRSF